MDKHYFLYFEDSGSFLIVFFEFIFFSRVCLLSGCWLLVGHRAQEQNGTGVIIAGLGQNEILFYFPLS